VVYDSFGMDRDEVPAAVLRLLLGFRRTTETSQQRVMEVVDGMVTRGELIQEGNHVSLPG
jgi:polyhydroxyalkanoate synthesis regulator phasin